MSNLGKATITTLEIAEMMEVEHKRLHFMKPLHVPGSEQHSLFARELVCQEVAAEFGHFIALIFFPAGS